MSRRATLLVLSSCFFAGCASYSEGHLHDRELALATLEDRLGSSAPRIDDAAVEDFLRERLADGLSEEDAVQIALVANPGLRQRAAELGIASAELVEAHRLPNPVLSANAKFFSSGTEIELGLVQPFLALLARPAQQASSRARRDEEVASLAREGIHLAFDVRRAFAHYRAAQRILALEVASHDLESQSFALVRDLHAAGNFDDRGLSLASAQLSGARLRLGEAQLAASEEREPLNRLLGLWGPHADWEASEAPPDDAAPAAVPPEVEEQALHASLDLQARRARVDWAAQRAGVDVRSSVLPDAQLGLAAKHETDGEWGLGPALEFSLPIFDRGDARRSRADAELEREVQAYRELEIEIRSAARVFTLRAQASDARARTTRGEHLPALGRVVREELRQYNAMQIGVFDVLRARARELDAELAAVTAERDARKARLDLQELLAGSLPRERIDARLSANSSHDPSAAGGEEHR